MGNACTRKHPSAVAVPVENAEEPLNKSNLPRPRVLSNGARKVSENVVYGNNQTIVGPINLEPSAQQGPSTTLTNNLMASTGTGLVPVNHYVTDPYLNATYVKVTDYGSQRGWRTTDTAYPMNNTVTVVQKISHTEMTHAPLNGPVTTITHDVKEPEVVIYQDPAMNETVNQGGIYKPQVIV